MGVTIKSKIDGFRRGGIVHRAEGTYYPDGVLTEQQLEQFRREPQLVVIEQVQPAGAVGLDDESQRLMQEMGDTIAALEHELKEVNTGRKLVISELELANQELEAERSYRLAMFSRQEALPSQVVEMLNLLEPEDPTQEGVVCIKADNLAALIADLLKPQQKTPEAQDDANRSTLSNAGGDESPTPAPVPPVAPADGAQAGVVTPDKVAGKRGKAAQKDAD
ncbi:TPA: HI1506-related protein [Pseudomonas putida]|uniref:HI1506-related protein n=1 Tax=Pseudomonas sp. TaxID=306 RepID=UPI0026498D92|nr:HI1506-related protein [Pseudomonas sp.]MDN5520216.1 HI1506-related protein [Pseudomonas sp.]MDN5531999.1 HI1506-related protein [Pseudomonas sp.]